MVVLAFLTTLALLQFSDRRAEIGPGSTSADGLAWVSFRRTMFEFCHVATSYYPRAITLLKG